MKLCHTTFVDAKFILPWRPKNEIRGITFKRKQNLSTNNIELEEYYNIHKYLKYSTHLIHIDILIWII